MQIFYTAQINYVHKALFVQEPFCLAKLAKADKNPYICSLYLKVLTVFGEYIIPFSSLKPGKNLFSYSVGASFFKEFEHSVIQNANINVGLSVDKHSTMLVFDFTIKGEVISECDRCSDEIKVALDNTEKLIVKFGEESFEEETEEIVVLPHGTQEINIAPYIYEFTHLSVPQRKTHENEKDCNQLVLQKLNELKGDKKSTTIDPRWEVLKNLQL